MQFTQDQILESTSHGNLLGLLPGPCLEGLADAQPDRRARTVARLQETPDNDLIDKMAKGDAKKAAALRELLGAPEGFDVSEVRH